MEEIWKDIILVSELIKRLEEMLDDKKQTVLRAVNM